MKRVFWGELLLIFCFFLTIFGFFYFEPSWPLRILAVILGLTGLAVFRRDSEILILTVLYLGLYDLYNIRYGLSLPLAPILVIVLVLTGFLFYLFAAAGEIIPRLNKERFWLYSTSIGLIILEIFLTMSLWPVDPKIKSLVLALTFYLLTKVFYLHVHNVLNLKRIAGLLIATVIIFTLVLTLNWWLWFRGDI